MITTLNELTKKIAAGLISCYQLTRFLRRPSCRFTPSCSEYARRSILRHGLWKGILAGAIRISKCHPWNDGGIDEVPEIFSLKKLIKNPER